MLYFSKSRVIVVIIFALTISYFAASNFFSFDDNYLKRKINLGLDLQGGSYLLLEVDNKPVITKQLQSKVIEIKKHFKDKNISVKNFKVTNENIILILILKMLTLLKKNY